MKEFLKQYQYICEICYLIAFILKVLICFSLVYIISVNDKMAKEANPTVNPHVIHRLVDDIDGVVQHLLEVLPVKVARHILPPYQVQNVGRKKCGAQHLEK